MEREIKFKGIKVKDSKWIIERGGYFRAFGFAWLEDYFGNQNEIVPGTICQYTGLKDKNGVEIYEGDYLVDYYEFENEYEERTIGISLLPVVFDTENLAWCVDNSYKKDGSCLTPFVKYFGVDNLEVRGNIHDKLTEI